MAIRRYQGNFDIALPLPVATAQYVEALDLVALQSNTIVTAADITAGTTVATPTAPTVADGAVAVGSPLTNAATGVKISYQFPWGEGALSAAGTATPTAGALLKVSGAPLIPATNALWTNIYVETAAGSGVYKLWGQTKGGATVMVSSYGTGRVPPTAVGTTAKEVTQYTFSQLFAGISNQRKCSATGPNQPPFPPNYARVYGNSQDNVIMVMRGGIFEADCASASFNSGDWIGADWDAVNSVLINQQVVAVPDPSLAVGRCVQKATSVTKVLFEIRASALLPQMAQIPTLADN